MKASSEIQAEGIAAFHRGECSTGARTESTANFLARMEESMADWKAKPEVSSMAIWIELRDLHRLLALANQRG